MIFSAHRIGILSQIEGEIEYLIEYVGPNKGCILWFHVIKKIPGQNFDLKPSPRGARSL